MASVPAMLTAEATDEVACVPCAKAAERGAEVERAIGMRDAGGLRYRSKACERRWIRQRQRSLKLQLMRYWQHSLGEAC